MRVWPCSRKFSTSAQLSLESGSDIICYLGHPLPSRIRGHCTQPYLHDQPERDGSPFDLLISPLPHLLQTTERRKLLARHLSRFWTVRHWERILCIYINTHRCIALVFADCTARTRHSSMGRCWMGYRILPEALPRASRSAKIRLAAVVPWRSFWIWHLWSRARLIIINNRFLFFFFFSFFYFFLRFLFPLSDSTPSLIIICSGSISLLIGSLYFFINWSLPIGKKLSRHWHKLLECIIFQIIITLARWWFQIRSSTEKLASGIQMGINYRLYAIEKVRLGSKWMKNMRPRIICIDNWMYCLLWKGGNL